MMPGIISTVSSLAFDSAIKLYDIVNFRNAQQRLIVARCVAILCLYLLITLRIPHQHLNLLGHLKPNKQSGIL